MHKHLPTTPGVYIMKDARGRVIYVGKATNLRSRVRSYWRKQKAVSRPQVKDLIRAVRTIDYETTLTVIEALIREANLIKKYEPKYNIIQKDDKSFLYLAITRDEFPRPLLVRGHELEKVGDLPRLPRGKAGRRYRAVFGPYTSPTALRAALKIVRRIFPWSTCLPGQKRPCFDYHLRSCPGVCVGAVRRDEYAKTIRGLILFFQGKKSQVVRAFRKEMQRLSAAQKYEEAEAVRRKIWALEHIQDIAVLTREESPLFGKPRLEELAINIFGRIEGYDISNISGTSPVGSMVVFKDGEPQKSQYRLFHIRSVKGIDDYAMMREVLVRRTRRTDWPRPDFILIDGGWGQVNVARAVLDATHWNIPVVGIAKGFDRKQDRLIYPKDNLELARVVEQYKDILLNLRDEAHRFAIAFHRRVRRKTSLRA